MKQAMYAGSFDPFTNGHLDILKEASYIFDVVYICIATNTKKTRTVSEINTKIAIEHILKRECVSNVKVIIYDGLVAEFCKKNNIEYLIRGLRNTSDYIYEENIAKINLEINPDLKTVYFRAKNDVISSTMVREFMHFNRSVKEYVPEEIWYLLKECYEENKIAKISKERKEKE